MAVAGNVFFFQWEASLMVWLQTHLGPAAVKLLGWFSAFGEELLLILILGFLIWGYDKKLGKTIGLTMLMGLVWNPMFKNIVLRRRPYFDNKEIQIYRVVSPDADIYDISAQGYSFPSGHSMNAAIAYAGIAAGVRKRSVRIIAAVLILLTGISRVLVGAHYPTDVLAGWAMGLLLVSLIPWLEKTIGNRCLFFALLLVLTLPGLLWCGTKDYYSGLGLLLGFMAADLVEEKYIRYEVKGSLLRRILRVIGGGVIYFALGKLLKMPFSSEFLESGTRAALLVCTARYAVIAFVEFAIYPLLFVYF